MEAFEARTVYSEVFHGQGDGDVSEIPAADDWGLGIVHGTSVIIGHTVEAGLEEFRAHKDGDPDDQFVDSGSGVVFEEVYFNPVIVGFYFSVN